MSSAPLPSAARLNRNVSGWPGSGAAKSIWTPSLRGIERRIGRSIAGPSTPVKVKLPEPGWPDQRIVAGWRKPPRQKPSRSPVRDSSRISSVRPSTRERPVARRALLLGKGRRGAEQEQSGKQDADHDGLSGDKGGAARSTIQAVTIAEMSTAAWSRIGSDQRARLDIDDSRSPAPSTAVTSVPATPW